MQQPPQNPARRVPGMAPEGLQPTGAAKPGPLGPRVVTPEGARALTDMTEEMRKAREAPPEQPPGSGEPETGGEKGEEILKKEEPDFFENLRRTAFANPSAIRDLVFAQRMGFMDSKERRGKIEARCTKPIEFDEFVLRGEVTQEVFPWPNSNVSVVFRTADIDDEIIIREYLSGGDYSQPLVGEVAQALLTLASGLVRIGDVKLTELPPSGSPMAERKKIFERRIKEVKRPFVLIWDLYINYLWFGGRVREALYGKDGNFRPVDQK